MYIYTNMFEAKCLVDEECTGVKGMLAKAKRLKASHCLQIPSPWCIQLTITGLLELHSGLRRCTQKSKCICRQLDPEKAFLRTTLKKRSADISCPQEPAHIGGNGEQPTPRKSRGSRTARLQIAMKGIHISIAMYNQTGFCSWASIRLFAPRKKHSRCQRSGWISI